jgi:hypothetical protein
MRKHRRWFTITVASGFVALFGIGLSGGQADDSKRLTADDVIRLWKLNGVEDFQSFGGSPEESPGVAAHAFRVIGPSFEGVWNQYADLCGIGERYQARRLLISGRTTAKGRCVVTEQASSDAKETQGLSVFLLRTDRYTVTATIRPGPDGKSVLGSIVAVIP